MKAIIFLRRPASEDQRNFEEEIKKVALEIEEEEAEYVELMKGGRDREKRKEDEGRDRDRE